MKLAMAPVYIAGKTVIQVYDFDATRLILHFVRCISSEAVFRASVRDEPGAIWSLAVL